MNTNFSISSSSEHHLPAWTVAKPDCWAGVLSVALWLLLFYRDQVRVPHWLKKKEASFIIDVSEQLNSWGFVDLNGDNLESQLLSWGHHLWSCLQDSAVSIEKANNFHFFFWQAWKATTALEVKRKKKEKEAHIQTKAKTIDKSYQAQRKLLYWHYWGWLSTVPAAEFPS